LYRLKQLVGLFLDYRIKLTSSYQLLTFTSLTPSLDWWWSLFWNNERDFSPYGKCI